MKTTVLPSSLENTLHQRSAIAALSIACALLATGCGPNTEDSKTADANTYSEAAESGNLAAESSQPASTGSGSGAAGTGTSSSDSMVSANSGGSDDMRTIPEPDAAGSRSTPSHSFAQTPPQNPASVDSAAAPSEQRIRTELRDGALAMDDSLLQQIDIRVNDQTVILSGTVPTEQVIQQIEQRVRLIDGVQRIDNRLEARSAAE